MEFKKETVRNIHAKRMTLSVHIDVIAPVSLTSLSNQWLHPNVLISYFSLAFQKSITASLPTNLPSQRTGNISEFSKHLLALSTTFDFNPLIALNLFLILFLDVILGN